MGIPGSVCLHHKAGLTHVTNLSPNIFPSVPYCPLDRVPGILGQIETEQANWLSPDGLQECPKNIKAHKSALTLVDTNDSLTARNASVVLEEIIPGRNLVWNILGGGGGEGGLFYVAIRCFFVVVYAIVGVATHEECSISLECL